MSVTGWGLGGSYSGSVVAGEWFAPSMREAYRQGVEQVLRRAVLIWAAVVGPVEVGSAARAVDGYHAAWLLFAAFGLHGVVWILTAVRRWPAWPVVCSWAGFVIVHHALVAEPALPNVYRTAVLMSLGLAVVVGLALPWRAAVRATVALAAGLPILLAWRAGISIWSAPIGQLVVASLAFGFGFAIAARALRTAAARADDATGSRLASAAIAEDDERRLAETRGRLRLLHDTAVNTLAAIASARVVSDAEVVTRRALADVAVLDALLDDDGAAEGGLTDLVDHAARLGLTVAGDLDPVRTVLDNHDPTRRAAVLEVLREAITNVEKHTRGKVVTLGAEPAEQRIWVSDDGVWPADAPAPGRVAARLRERTGAAGLTVTVATGARTEVSVHPTLLVDNDQADHDRDVFEPSARWMAAAIGGVMVVNLAIQTLLAATVDPSAQPLLAWVLVAGAAALMLVSHRRGRRLPVPTVLVGYVAMLAALAWASPWGATCPVDGVATWGPEGAATIAVMFVILDGRWRVVAPALAFIVLCIDVIAVLRGDGLFACAGAPFAGIIQASCLVLAMMLLRRQMERLSRIVAEETEETIRLAGWRDSRVDQEALRRAGLQSVLASAREVLLEVAAAPESRHESEVRERAAREESYLRVLIGLSSPSTAVLTHVVVMIELARRRSVVVTLLSQVPELTEEQAVVVFEAVEGLISGLRPGDSVSFSVHEDQGRPALVLACPASAVAGLATGATVVVDGDLAVVEMTWRD
ncbi:MAG: hypothetical protein QM714_16530 [Nocardioides sp.]|uniref:hypothetical protein n=1 Tax=Nocardioides sp. TaxID=35761 RepID=UPI0039E364DC